MQEPLAKAAAAAQACPPQKAKRPGLVQAGRSDCGSCPPAPAPPQVANHSAPRGHRSLRRSSRRAEAKARQPLRAPLLSSPPPLAPSAPSYTPSKLSKLLATERLGNTGAVAWVWASVQR